MDIRVLADLLREAEEHHGRYEATAPKHHWWDWYAAYVDARERGNTPEQALAVAGLYMEGLLTKRFGTANQNVAKDEVRRAGRHRSCQKPLHCAHSRRREEKESDCATTRVHAPLTALFLGAAAGIVGTTAMDLVEFRRYRANGGTQGLAKWETAAGSQRLGRRLSARTVWKVDGRDGHAPRSLGQMGTGGDEPGALGDRGRVGRAVRTPQRLGATPSVAFGRAPRPDGVGVRIRHFALGKDLQADLEIRPDHAGQGSAERTWRTGASPPSASRC